jgi:hypothetical protein
VLFDLLAQLGNVDAKVLGVFGMRRSPHGGENLFVGDLGPIADLNE